MRDTQPPPQRRLYYYYYYYYYYYCYCHPRGVGPFAFQLAPPALGPASGRHPIDRPPSTNQPCGRWPATPTGLVLHMS